MSTEEPKSDKLQYFYTYDQYVHKHYSSDGVSKREKDIEKYRRMINTCIDKRHVIDLTQIKAYNVLIGFDNIRKDISRFKEHTNKYTQFRSTAMLSGRTMQYSLQFPEDKDFADVIKEYVTNFIGIEKN